MGGLGSPTNPTVGFDAVRPAAFARILVITCAGVRPVHGPAAPLSPKHRATTPATCGEAMLVPEIVWYLLPGQVERMHTPGPAIAWAASALPSVVKLLKPAAASSFSK